jgi:hypothetical protein
LLLGAESEAKDCNDAVSSGTIHERFTRVLLDSEHEGEIIDVSFVPSSYKA